MIHFASQQPSESTEEIEITPEMVEAGYRVFVASGITDDPLEADKLLVQKIYEAMELSRRSVEAVDAIPVYRLSDLVAGITDENRHGEIGTGAAQGNEFA